MYILFVIDEYVIATYENSTKIFELNVKNT